MLITCITLFGFSSMAQDIILRKDGVEIKAKVLEITEEYIKYKEFDFQNGPIRNVNKVEVFMITYENGKKEVLNAQTDKSNLKGKTVETRQVEDCTVASCELLVICSDYPRILTYDEAISKCPSGYRLPTIDELLCLAQNKADFHLKDFGEYLSVTKIGNKILTVTMDDGKQEECAKDEKKWVRYIKADANTNYKALNQLFEEADKPSNNNYALLHLYRPAMFVGSAVWFDIDLDNQEIWRCKNDRKITIKLTKEVPVTIHARTEASSSVVINVEFGKEYYIECTLGMGVWVGRPILTQKDESVGHSMYNRVKKDDTIP